MKMKPSLLALLGITMLLNVREGLSQTLYAPGGTLGTSTNSNVGIGTSATPGFKLDVVGNSMKFRHSSSGEIFFRTNDGGLELTDGNDDMAYIDFKGRANATTDYIGRIIYNDGNTGTFEAQEGMIFLVGGGIYSMMLHENGFTGIGTLGPTQKLDVEGNIRWGTSSNPEWGDGLLSLESGWASGSYPTIGSTSGTSGSLIMLHNPHIPFRTDNGAPGYAGRSGLRLASDVNASAAWDIGLAGDFFNIYRHGSGEFFRILNNGSIGIGTQGPTSTLHIVGSTSDATPNLVGTQISSGAVELTRDGAAPYIDFQNDINGTDYDARIRLSGDNSLRVEGSNLLLGDNDVREVRGLQFKDWDDNTGGEDDKYRVLARDGAIMFYNGGVTIGGFANGTWTDLPDGSLVVKNDLAIGVNTPPSGYKLAVGGNAIMEEVRVELIANWPDYVFEENYDLRPIEEVETFVKENGHLPEIPSAADVKENGIALGEMDAKLLEKIEELTLYVIELNKAVKNQNEEITQLKTKNAELEKKLSDQ